MSNMAGSYTHTHHTNTHKPTQITNTHVRIRIQFNSQVVYTTRNLLWWQGAYSKHLRILIVFKYQKYKMFFKAYQQLHIKHSWLLHNTHTLAQTDAHTLTHVHTLNTHVLDLTLWWLGLMQRTKYGLHLQNIHTFVWVCVCVWESVCVFVFCVFVNLSIFSTSSCRLLWNLALPVLAWYQRAVLPLPWAVRCCEKLSECFRNKLDTI